ncbi:hypothetical protein ACJW31_11G162100 [Castanea mollissima]
MYLIQSLDGDMVDCVDIKKQPAFDHPLLKNHTIQATKGFLFKESNNVFSNSKPIITQPWHLNGRCPEGSIPIRRTKEEDLLRASTVANYGRKKYDMIPDDDFSTHGVYYELYSDYETRLFTYWTNNGYQSGCYNQQCPGFVQIDNRIAFGATFLPYSVYGVRQDNVYGHWWLQLANTYLMGYWPASLFLFLSNGASRVTWGGEVINKGFGEQHTTAQMGNGHFAEEGPTRASFIQNLKVIDHEQVLRRPRDIHEIVTNPSCYNLLRQNDFFYYGGRGRSFLCP